MNFLAHLYLSGKNEDIIIGNFIADHVKGNGINKFSNGIKAGIHLHRAIDAFTDNHPVFLASRDRLLGKYKKYSGVIVDMFYDHFLSANWNNYSNEELVLYTKRMYKIVMKKYLILPAKTKMLLPFMAKDNWLVGYGSMDGIGRALSGMARRTPFESGMENAILDLKKYYVLFKSEFEEFFPEIIEFASRERDQIQLI